jgi:UDP-N-acetylmuramoyl-L-alanyl-D-glutamate--2,6-diaminopimelate ligase
MLLEALVRLLAPERVLQPDWGVEITGLSADSRSVAPGHLFAALAGTKADGAAYAREAESRGAAAILTEKPEPLTRLPQLVVRQARTAVARAARFLNGWPDRRLRLGAVTGTNGKTTTAFLVRHLLRACGVPCGMLGTIEYDLGARTLPAPLTTPDAVELQACLREMVEARRRACIMEVSSHSLCLGRVEGLEFAAAGFSNLTQDHLDYHRTMEAYREAKAALFRGLTSRAVAVLNLDDPAGEYYAGLTRARVLGYSLRNHPGAELRARVLSLDLQGTTFELESPWGRREVRWRLCGRHNVENALLAAGVAVAMGIESGEGCRSRFDQLLAALTRFAGVPGRLEAVSDGLAPFRVLVDYAHTDDALRNVLQAMRALNPSRIIVVFGCGGDRDRGKRPKMAKAVEELADLGIITSDNPRTEEPEQIFDDIRAGVSKPEKFLEEHDRAAAIDRAVREAQAGDVVLIAGKGHEDYQIVGREKRRFDDREEACAALARRFEAALRRCAAGGV